MTAQGMPVQVRGRCEGHIWDVGARHQATHDAEERLHARIRADWARSPGERLKLSGLGFTLEAPYKGHTHPWHAPTPDAPAPSRDPARAAIFDDPIVVREDTKALAALLALQATRVRVSDGHLDELRAMAIARRTAIARGEEALPALPEGMEGAPARPPTLSSGGTRRARKRAARDR